MGNLGLACVCSLSSFPEQMTVLVSATVSFITFIFPKHSPYGFPCLPCLSLQSQAQLQLSALNLWNAVFVIL